MLHDRHSTHHRRPRSTGPVLDWFVATFPGGPTPAQAEAWPIIAGRENLLLISPTGTGKTLAAFLALLEPLSAKPPPGPCRPGSGASTSRRSGASGTTSSATSRARSKRSASRWAGTTARSASASGPATPRPYQRRKLRDDPPQILITTPESLSLMLSQKAWDPHWREVRSIDRRRGPRPGRVESAGPISPSRSNGWRPRRRSTPPRRALGHLPAARARRPVPGRARSNLPRGRGRPARGDAAARLGGRVADQTRRGAAPRADLPSPDPPDQGGDDRGADERRLRQHPRLHREDHPRPPPRAGRRRGATIAAHHSALDAERRREVEAQLKAGELERSSPAPASNSGSTSARRTSRSSSGCPGAWRGASSASAARGTTSGCRRAG